MLRSKVMATAAACAMLIAVPVFAPALPSLVAQAQAQTDISVNIGFGSFYDGLQPYGDWVSVEDQYVFVPQHLSHGWRPYTVGHWSYTKQYGWLWVSEEKFGWATYHYGRWGYSRDIGWYWIPGRRWAPAWVAWSRGHNHVAWAPLPPRRGYHGDDTEVSFTVDDVPDYYWQAVPTTAFLSINLSEKIIVDREQVRTIVQQAPPQTVHVENNIVINNVIQVNEIEQATNQKVPVLAVQTVKSPDAVNSTNATTVAVFNPEVKADTTAKPQKPVQVEAIATARKADGNPPEDLTAGQAGTSAPKADATAPKADATAPKADATAPKADATAPKADATAPKADATAPKADATAPKADATAPKADAAAPKADATAPKADATAPKADATAPKADATAPKVDATAPKVDATAPKADANAPKVDATAPKADANANGAASKAKAPPPAADAKPTVVTPLVKTPDVKTAPPTAPAVVSPKTTKPEVAAPQPPAVKASPDVGAQKKDSAPAMAPKAPDTKAAPPAAAKVPPADSKNAKQPATKDEKGGAKCDPKTQACDQPAQ